MNNKVQGVMREVWAKKTGSGESNFIGEDRAGLKQSNQMSLPVHHGVVEDQCSSQPRVCMVLAGAASATRKGGAKQSRVTTPVTTHS